MYIINLNLLPIIFCCTTRIQEKEKMVKTTFAAILTLIASSQVAAFAPQNAFTRTATSSNVVLSMANAIDDKTEVREYFNTEGFNRWNKIYSESDDVNTVQLDIRNGHDQTIQKILNWVEADGDIKGKTVCDCGCGVGSLAIPLAQMGKSFVTTLICLSATKRLSFPSDNFK